MPQHPSAEQLRAAGHPLRGARRGPAVRAQDRRDGKPSKANEEAFNRAVHDIAHATEHLLADLVSTAPPKNRDEEAAKARARSAKRFATA